MPVKQAGIDVHHHFIPPALVAEMERRGIKEVASTPLPDWSLEQSIATMDANGIQTAIVSLSAPGVHFGDEQDAIALAPVE